eukprot:21031_1
MNRKYLYRFGVKSLSKFSSHYTIDDEIGGGGQGAVWGVSNKTANSIHSKHSSSPKCIKLFKIDVTDFEQSLKSFNRLIRIYHHIRNNNLSDYYEIYGNCDTQYHSWTGIMILMKRYHHTLCDRKYYLKSTDLYQTQTEFDREGNGNTTTCNTIKPLSEDEITVKLNQGYVCGEHPRFVKKITTDLLDHLHSMHQAHIIHNDIKPDNIVFDSQRGLWRLIDFDLSMTVQVDGVEGLLLHSKYRGSPFYSPPEIRIDATPKAPNIYSKCGDVFSVAMVISWLILHRNHIWYFINYGARTGEINDDKDTFMSYYFNELCRSTPDKEDAMLKCIAEYGMNKKMDQTMLELLGFMLKIDFRQRKNVNYLRKYMKTN